MSYRYADPELLQLGRPPALAARPFDDIYAEAIADAILRLGAIGVSYTVEAIKADTVGVVTRGSATRDMVLRQQIDDAVAETYLGSARKVNLDHRAADYGVVRQVIQFANPVTGAPLLMEDDDSFRFRTRLAWEAASVAGPAWAYVFHALTSHPGVLDVLALGPESGLVMPGEVLIVVQSRTDFGVPSDAMLDVVAAALDAYEVVYGDGSSVIRPVRDEQAKRPLGARVTVIGGRPLFYSTSATLYVGAYADQAALQAQALEKVTAYQGKLQRLWRRIPREGRQAALSLVGADGLPVIDEVVVVEDDVQPSHLEIPVPLTTTLTTVVR